MARRRRKAAAAAPVVPTSAGVSSPAGLPAWVWDAALVALVVVAYLPAFGNGWIWDDDDYVTANAALRSLDGLRRLWLEPGVVPQYYPVTFTSLWVEWQLWGAWAPGYHATNVLLHAVNAVLAWRLLDRLRVPGAWIAAALFAVHPVHVESVAWVTERKNVLSGMFYLAAALVFFARVAGTAPGEAGRRRAYTIVLVLFVLALLSKSVTATLPAALAIGLWWREGRVRREDLLLLVPLLVLGGAAGGLTAWMERHRVGAVGPYWDQTLVERGLIGGRALWFYVGKLVWPHPLAFNYERWAIDARDARQWLWPAAACGVAAVAWGLRRRVGRGPIAAMAFFVVTLAPALGFVNVYPMRYAFVADHFQYLASLAVLALVAAGVAGLAGSRARTAVVPLLVLLGPLTWQQSRAYADVETLWRDTIAKNPRSVLALQNLGTIAFGRGRFGEATGLYEHALAVEPELPDAWNGLGLAQAGSGRHGEAMRSFENALRFDPRHAEAARNLGSVLGAAGRRDEAIAAYESAIASAPGMVEAREDVAVLLVAAERLGEAEAQLREAVRLSPHSLRARMQLGAVLGRQGRWAEAVRACDEAVRVAPRAIEPQAALAEALARSGEFEQAATVAERAKARAAGDGETSTVAELERRIGLYRAGSVAMDQVGR